MKHSISDDFINRLRAESNIVGVISDYVPLKKKGKNYWGCCPFHHEKTPSFSVTPDKGFYYCFGCQTGGSVFNFLMKIENVGFLDAVKVLAKKMNISLPEKEKSAQDLARERELAQLYRVNDMARDFFHSCLLKTSYGIQAREYLASRGVTTDIIEKFNLGFAPPLWDKLSQAFQKRNISPEVLINSGLAAERTNGNGLYDRFRSRIIFPICNARGKVIGFGGRVIDDSQPKYLNSPETALFNKRHVLYGFDTAYRYIKELGRAVVVEGYMDALTAHANGINNVVASLGTAFTPEQAKLLLQCAEEIVFAYDSDAAGQNATIRALSIAQDLGAKVKIISIPGDKDPDEYMRNHGADAFAKLIANADNLLEYQVKKALESIDYSSLEGKVAVVARTVPVLAAANNAVEVNDHIARLAQTLGIDESSVRSEVRKYMSFYQKDKTVNFGKNINRLTVLNKPSAATEQAEKHIIRLLCDDNTLIPYVQAQISADDFCNKNHQEIIKLIFDAYNMGKNIIDSAWFINLSDAANCELSHIMLIEMESSDVIKLVDDCIRNIRLTHLKLLYEQHRLKADELERMGDSRFLQELAESQRIKDEISKIHTS